MLNWKPEAIAEAARVAAAAGAPSPCAAQLPCSLAQPELVEDPAMSAALDTARAGVVASFVLAGGALTGKYAGSRSEGRLAAQLDAPRHRRALEVGERLRALAEALETTACRLAISFVLSDTRVASVLFGATSAEQVLDNVAALGLAQRLDRSDLAELRGLAASHA